MGLSVDALFLKLAVFPRTLTTGPYSVGSGVTMETVIQRIVGVKGDAC